MLFQLTEEQEALRAMVADFAAEEILPYADEWDEKSHFPVDTLRKAAALGMAGIVVSEDIGGAQLGRLESAIIFEQLACACVSTSTYLSVHNMVCAVIDRYASDDLRKKWGPRLCTMELFASYCLTEPESGSDAAALKTKAVRDGDHYIVNGSKAFISGAGNSDLYLCMVRTGDDSYKGISCLLIEKNTPGLSFGKAEKKLGWKNQPTCMVYFENCRVPVTNLVGEEGIGFRIALNALNGGRVNIAAASIGGALAAVRRAKTYMHERKQFAKPLADMQALRFYFANMITSLEAARLMTYRAAVSLDNKDPLAQLHCAMAKRFATDSAFEIANQSLQLHGGYGCLRDYQIERIFRDLRINQIVEGSNEIMYEIIAKITLDVEDQAL